MFFSPAFPSVSLSGKLTLSCCSNGQDAFIASLRASRHGWPTSQVGRNECVKEGRLWAFLMCKQLCLRVLTTEVAFIVTERTVCTEVAQFVQWDSRSLVTVVLPFQCDVRAWRGRWTAKGGKEEAKKCVTLFSHTLSVTAPTVKYFQSLENYFLVVAANHKK